MKIEIIAIGNEILSGRTINTNAAYISSHLNKLGYKVHYQSVLSDEEKSIQNGLKEAIKRSTLIIVTGGLGPTIDDKTKQIVCELLNIDLEYKKELAIDLKKRFGEITSIEEQSTVPKNAFIFQNEVGTAPGFVFISSGKAVMFLPGVPKEMIDMFDHQSIGFIQKHFPLKEKKFQKKFNICLVPELRVNELLKNIQSDDIEIGIYPSYSGIQVILTTKAINELEANKKVSSIAKYILQEFSEYVFPSENCKIEEAIHELFILKKLKLAFAESCSGGSLSNKITSLPGSSDYYLGSIVAYSNEMKKQVLKVSDKTLDEHGAVSIPMVKEMIDGIFSITNADYAIAISGIAGPGGGTLEKPIGTVYIAIGKRGEATDAGVLHFQGNRDVIVALAVYHAFSILFRRVAHNLSCFEE